MEAATMAFLVAAAFVAAFVDSIVGGGGVITLPALLATGMDPHLALGTNKLAATGASGVATLNYVRHGSARTWLALQLAGLAGLGSLFGARTVLGMRDEVVASLVLVAMVAMVLFIWRRPAFGRVGATDALSGPRRLGLAFVALGVGFYDGFLGPGTGSFLLFGLVSVGGLAFLPAAGHGRVLNFASNLAALGYFAVAGEVAYAIGLPMLAATLVGGFVGSRFGIRHGARLIRPLFLVMSLALAGKLAWDLL